MILISGDRYLIVQMPLEQNWFVGPNRTFAPEIITDGYLPSE